MAFAFEEAYKQRQTLGHRQIDRTQPESQRWTLRTDFPWIPLGHLTMYEHLEG